MDQHNPCYNFQSSLPPAALEVNDKEALKNLNESLSLLNSQISTTEAPSVKLMKKCSIRRLLNGKPKHPPVARTQSLTHTQNLENDDFIVERSKSFSSSSSSAPSPMSHPASSTAQRRASFGSVCIQRQPTTVHQQSKKFIYKTHVAKRNLCI